MIAARAVLALLLATTAGCGARSDLALAGDAGPRPHLLCPGSPAEPVLLQTVGPYQSYDRATSITAAGSYVYYEVNDGSNEPLAIYEAPIAGGAATPLVLGVAGCTSSPFGFGDLVTDGHYLYTPDAVQVDLCTGSSLDITAFDIKAGTTTTLPNPPSPVMRFTGAVRAAPGGGAIWLYGDTTPGSDTWVVRWDGTSTTVLAKVPGYASDFVIAGESALVLGEQSLSLVSLTGAADVAAIGTPDFGKFAFVGANGTAFFYTPDGVSIDRRDAATGEVTTIVQAADPVGASSDAMWADDRWVYFRMGTQTSGGAELGRVPVMGGEIETIYDDPMRDGIDAVTADACNIYWVGGIDFDGSRPPALYVRGR